MIPMGRANIRPVDPSERVRELTWAMVDEQIEDNQWSELQKLLTDNTAARLAYIEAIQLHTDLLFHFRDPQTDESTKKQETPILGSLGGSAAIAAPTMEVGS